MLGNWLPRSRRKKYQTGGLRPLTWWWVGLYALVALGIGAAVIWWLWPPALESPTEAITARTGAVRTGLATAGGAGAAFTLLLAVRRQRTTEHDARQQRMTELYTAAAEQLGHERAAVRLAGLYALQRLGQSYPEQRHAIVNLWCAYLRMPFHDPKADDLGEAQRAERRQELEVRLTVQRLLRAHAHSGPRDDKPASPRYWGDELDVNLTGATLYQLDLKHFRIHPHTTFTSAQFLGATSFVETEFGNGISFISAEFSNYTRFTKARFANNTAFTVAKFGNGTSFARARFGHDTSFDGAEFGNDTRFDEARFGGNTSFARARFGGTISFLHTVAPCRDGHVWPQGWELQPVEHVPAQKCGDPNVVWGRLVPVPGSGADPQAGSA